MKYSELVRRLRQLGFRRLREGSRHEIWGRPGTELRAPIPRHQAQEVPAGTLSQILKDLDLTRDDL